MCDFQQQVNCATTTVAPAAADDGGSQDEGVNGASIGSTGSDDKVVGVVPATSMKDALTMYSLVRHHMYIQLYCF